MDGLHHAMTIVLGIERHMTGALMPHGIVAHLIHDDLQQVISVARTLLVVVHQHQSIVGTVTELSRTTGIVKRINLLALLRLRWVHHHKYQQSRAVGTQLYLGQHIAYLHRIALGPLGQLYIVKRIQ